MNFLFFFLRLYGDMFRLLEAAFRLSIKEYIYIILYFYMLQCANVDEISFTLSY